MDERCGSGPVFIGGTGRSGTTILAEILGRHSCLFGVPTELRFHIDPDGLISLRRALVDDWSLFHADVAIERFESLMGDLRTRLRGRYPATGLAAVFTPERYDRAVERFTQRLERFSYRGTWAGRSSLLEQALLRAPGAARSGWTIRGEIHYGSVWSPDDFTAAARDFVEDLFEVRLAQEGKARWVEHTPMNLLHAPFLGEVFPGFKLLHIHRDPRDVVASYATKAWGPQDKRMAARIVTDTLNRWSDIRQTIPAGSFLELSFEELIEAPRAVLQRTSEFIGVEFEPSLLDVPLNRANIGRWKHDPDADIIRGLAQEFEWPTD